MFLGSLNTKLTKTPLWDKTFDEKLKMLLWTEAQYQNQDLFFVQNFILSVVVKWSVKQNFVYERVSNLFLKFLD